LERSIASKRIGIIPYFSVPKGVDSLLGVKAVGPGGGELGLAGTDRRQADEVVAARQHAQVQDLFVLQYFPTATIWL